MVQGPPASPHLSSPQDLPAKTNPGVFSVIAVLGHTETVLLASLRLDGVEETGRSYRRWASGAGPEAQAGVFGMGPSWWVACQVEVEQLCQRGAGRGPTCKPAMGIRSPGDMPGRWGK